MQIQPQMSIIKEESEVPAPNVEMDNLMKMIEKLATTQNEGEKLF